MIQLYRISMMVVVVVVVFVLIAVVPFLKPVESFSAKACTGTFNQDDLTTWARHNQIYMDPNVALSPVHDNNPSHRGVFGIADYNPPNGTVLLHVPSHVVWNAGNIYVELMLEEKQQQRAAVVQNNDALPVVSSLFQLDIVLQDLADQGYAQYLGEFILILKLLKEHANPDSAWRLWLDHGVPKSYTSAVYWSNDELECLPVLTRAVGQAEVCKCFAFGQAMQKLSLFPWIIDSFTNSCIYDNRLLKWAYATIVSRCFTVPNKDKQSLTLSPHTTSHHTMQFETAQIVPIGDMFNHQHPANVVVVVDQHNGSVDFVCRSNSIPTFSNDPMDTPSHRQEFCISYGVPTNAHRFLAVFGFCDTQMEELFCGLIFPNPNDQLRALGCTDFEKMVVRCTDGAIANAVRDSVLYSLLQKSHNPDAQLLYHAVVGNTSNTDLRQLLHRRYARTVDVVLVQHFDRKLREVDELCKQKTAWVANSHATNMGMVFRHNSFLREVFSKVVSRLTVKTMDGL